MRATDKPFNIDKKLVYEAYKAVQSNKGAAGVDGQTIEQFEAGLKSNLYKIWNRMSSGSYFPPPVRAVSIPKKSGGQRILGVPTVADRVAQMVVSVRVQGDRACAVHRWMHLQAALRQYCFRPRLVKRFRDNTLFCGFNPAVSSSAMKAMRSAIRELKLHHQTQLSLQDIAQQLNPLLRGWIEYYGRYASSALYPLLRHVNRTLIAWAMRKFKRFKDHKVRASQFLQCLATEHRSLFVHWDIGMTGVFA